MLSRYPTELNITWSTVASDRITSDYIFDLLTGTDILSLLKKDYSLKVFERLRTRLKKECMSKKMSLRNKMDIFEDYSHPQPFPMDKFLKLPSGSPDQAYLMIGTKGTGRYMFSDILCTRY